VPDDVALYKGCYNYVRAAAAVYKGCGCCGERSVPDDVVQQDFVKRYVTPYSVEVRCSELKCVAVS